MSKLNELLTEAEKTNERLKNAITNGDYDLMTKIERSKVELNNRIFFARRDELAERLNDLRIERQCAVELSGELADDLKTAADKVLAARSNLFDAEQAYQSVQSRQYFLDNQLEQNRVESNRVNAELNQHIKTRVNGVVTGLHGEMEAITNETTY